MNAKSHCFSELKAGAVDVWSKSFTLRQKPIWGFPPNGKVLCQEWDLWPERVTAFPTHLDVSSVTCCVGVSQLVSEFPSEEIYLCVAVYLVHRRRKVKSLLFNILLMSLC